MFQCLIEYFHRIVCSPPTRRSLVAYYPWIADTPNVEAELLEIIVAQ